MRRARWLRQLIDGAKDARRVLPVEGGGEKAGGPTREEGWTEALPGPSAPAFPAAFPRCLP